MKVITRDQLLNSQDERFKLFNELPTVTTNKESLFYLLAEVYEQLGENANLEKLINLAIKNLDPSIIEVNTRISGWHFSLEKYNEGLPYGVKALQLRHKESQKNKIPLKLNKWSNAGLVLSYSLFGKDASYVFPLLDSIGVAKYALNNPIIVVYHDNSIDIEVVELLKANSVELKLKKESVGLSGTFWRFEAIQDYPNKVIFFRDSDSLLTEREVKIIRSFSESEHSLCCIRDNHRHTHLILAGMFGIKANIDDIESTMPPEVMRSERLADQVYLAHSLWANFYNVSINYDWVYSDALPVRYAEFAWPKSLPMSFHIGAKNNIPSEKWLNIRPRQLGLRIPANSYEWLKNRAIKELNK